MGDSAIAQRVSEQLEDVRPRFGPSGVCSPEVVGLIRAIRMASSKAGYFHLAVPEAYAVLRLINVADGTNEILNRTIFQRLTGGDTDL